MQPMKLARSVAEAMARDVMDARRKALRRMTIDEGYTLMVLSENLKDVAQANWLESLANRFERGQHYLGRNLEIDDPEEEQAIANEMAGDLRELRQHITFEEPVTVERLRNAEEILGKYGIELKLVDRAMVPEDVPLN